MDPRGGPRKLTPMITWMTPSPRHAKGLLIYYGSQNLIEANAAYRGYDLGPFKDRCGVSAISPADLGKVVWLRVEDTEWYGPCLTIDVGAQIDFDYQVYYIGEVAEVSTYLRDYFRFPHGSSRPGEVFYGECPPDPNSIPSIYRPPIDFGRYLGINPRLKAPLQEWPIDCNR